MLNIAAYESLSVHICTKDRPTQLEELLVDIDEVVPSPRCVFVYDDSVDPTNRQKNRAALAAMPYPAAHIDEPARQALLSDLPWPSVQAEAYGKYAFKTLGNEGWDLAGVRSFAHFIGALTTAFEAKILFLDDDIGLRDGVFQGKRIKVDSKAITNTLSYFLSLGEIIGAQYAGRADEYMIEHLKAHNKRTALDPEPFTIPAHKATNNHSLLHYRSGRLVGGDYHKKPGGLPISGGFLLLRRDAVREVAVPHCFNEDQIFIAAAGREYRLRVAPFRPLHKGDTVVPTVAMAKMQQSGVVLLKAFQHALSELSMQAPGFVDRAMGLCDHYARRTVAEWRRTLDRSPVNHFRNATTQDATDLLNEFRIIEEATTILRTYLVKQAGWHDLIENQAVSAHIQNRLANIALH